MAKIQVTLDGNVMTAIKQEAVKRGMTTERIMHGIIMDSVQGQSRDGLAINQIKA